MSRRNDTLDAAELRRRAEDQLKERNIAAPREEDGDPRRLLHELEVHQIELEMQNEELRTARAQLEEGLARYRQLFEFAPIGYFLVSREGAIRELNFVGGQLLGSERRPLVGARLAAFVAEPQRKAFADFLAQLLATGDSQRLELTMKTLNGRLLEARATGTVLPRHEPVILLALQDVTAEKSAEGAARDANVQLVQADRRKDEFLAALSHELRNPLAPIRSSLYILDQAEAGSEAAKRAQAIIDRSIDHLTHLVEDLLDMTRISHGKIRLRRGPLELRALAHETIEDRRALFAEQGVALELLPPAGEVWVDGDRTRIVQAVGNLLMNAVKFTPRGGKVTVSVGADAAKGQAMVRVQDDGVGIAPEMLPRLFERFAQADETLARSEGGLGLGLALVKNLVELHGGSVRADSAGLGKGATFTITLPLRTAPVAALEVARSAPSARAYRRVLIIEDHPDVAEALSIALELNGHVVELATSGPEGLAKARSFRPEIIYCDIGLPGMDGYAVARALRAAADTRHIALVAISGYARPEDVGRSKEAGFDAHLPKPPDIAEVLEQAQNLPAATA